MNRGPYFIFFAAIVLALCSSYARAQDECEDSLRIYYEKGFRSQSHQVELSRELKNRILDVFDLSLEEKDKLGESAHGHLQASIFTMPIEERAELLVIRRAFVIYKQNTFLSKLSTGRWGNVKLCFGATGANCVIHARNLHGFFEFLECEGLLEYFALAGASHGNPISHVGTPLRRISDGRIWIFDSWTPLRDDGPNVHTAEIFDFANKHGFIQSVVTEGF